jgi:hypothetical protein
MQLFEQQVWLQIYCAVMSNASIKAFRSPEGALITAKNCANQGLEMFKERFPTFQFLSNGKDPIIPIKFDQPIYSNKTVIAPTPDEVDVNRETLPQIEISDPPTIDMTKNAIDDCPEENIYK